jgi:hypothetical protein
MKLPNLISLLSALTLLILPIACNSQETEVSEAIGIGIAEGTPDSASEQALAQALCDERN